METLQTFGGDEQNLNGSGRKALWEVLKRKYPKCSPSVPVGKRINLEILLLLIKG